MKILTMLFLSLFLAKGCDQSERSMENAVVEYTANSRGFYEQIILKNKTISINKDRNDTSAAKVIKVSDAEWEKLSLDFKTLDLENIPNLVAPTEKRFYDGAAIAGLKITYAGKEYQSQAFDHGHPPMPIKKIIDEILKYSQQK